MTSDTFTTPVQKEAPPPYIQNAESTNEKPNKTSQAWTDKNTIDIEETDTVCATAQQTSNSQEATQEVKDSKNRKGPVTWLMYLTVMHTRKMLLIWFTTMIVFSVTALILWPTVEFYSDDSEALRVSGHPSNYANDRQTAFYNAYPGFDGTRPTEANSLVHRRSAFSKLTPTKIQRLIVIYRSTNGDSRGVLESNALRRIRDAELALQRSSTYQKHCSRNSVGQCKSVNSIIPAYFPSYSSGGNLLYDMAGAIVPNIALATNRILLAYTDEVPFYYEATIQTTPTKSRILRSSFQFGNAGDSIDDIKHAMYAAQEKLRSFSNDDIMIVCGNDKLLDQDLEDALTHDYILLAISLLVLFGCMWVFLNSLYLALCGLMVIAISVPIAVFVYSVVFQIDYFDAINLVAIFVSLGIAVDDIFVFTNFFKQAKQSTPFASGGDTHTLPTAASPVVTVGSTEKVQTRLGDAGTPSCAQLHTVTAGAINPEAPEIHPIASLGLDTGTETQIEIEAEPQHPIVLALASESSRSDSRSVSGCSGNGVSETGEILSLEPEVKHPPTAPEAAVEVAVTDKGEAVQLYDMSDTELMDRLQRSYRKSAKAIFLTSMTTAASVLSTLVSPLKVVDTFGIFMAILVMTNYVLVVTLYPCLVVEWARRYENGPGFMSTVADWCRCQNKAVRHICEYDIHEALCKFFASHYTNGVLSTRIRRAVVAAVSGVILVASIIFTTQLNVSGDNFVVLRGHTNFQQWQDISHTFGDQLRGRGRCTDCATKIQSIQQGLSEVNLEGLLTAPVDLDPEKQYVPPPTNPSPAVIQDDGEGAGDTDASETPEDTANAAGSVAEVSTSPPATVEPAAPIDTDTATRTDPELLRFEGPLEVHPNGTCTAADANNLFQARLALDTACPTKQCDQTCGDAYAEYNDSYAHCADSISPARTLAVMEGYLSICSAAGYQQPAGNFSNTKNSAKPTDVKPGSTRPQQTSTWTPLPRERCGEVMRQELQTVLSTCGTFISGDSDCIQPCAVQLNAIQTQWSQCAAAKADMGVGEAETGQLEWLLQHCVAEKVVRLQRVRTVLVKLLWGVKDTFTEKVSDLRHIKLARDDGDEEVLLPVADGDFNFYSTNTQSDLLKLCHAIKDDKQLSQQHPSSVRCIALALEEWAGQMGLAYPLTGSQRQINRSVTRFLQSPQGRVFDDYLLWNEGKIAAVTVEVYTPFREGSDPFATYNYFHDWQRVIDDFNDNSHSDAVMTQSAEAWGDAVTQVTTVSGVGWSLSISALVAGLALLLFTQSPTLALTATALLGAVVLVVLGLAWCFGWEVGMVEALTLTMLMGLAVDYFIHLSEEYIGNSQDNTPHDSPETHRVSVVRASLRNIGASVVFSCISTVGSVFVLFFADLVMLRRMGVVIGIAILLSMTITLVVYAAALATWGPQMCHRNVKRFGWCVLAGCGVVAVLFLVLYILDVAGVGILKPDGTPLF